MHYIENKYNTIKDIVNKYNGTINDINNKYSNKIDNIEYFIKSLSLIGLYYFKLKSFINYETFEEFISLINEGIKKCLDKEFKKK